MGELVRDALDIRGGRVDSRYRAGDSSITAVSQSSGNFPGGIPEATPGQIGRQGTTGGIHSTPRPPLVQIMPEVGKSSVISLAMQAIAGRARSCLGSRKPASSPRSRRSVWIRSTNPSDASSRPPTALANGRAFLVAHEIYRTAKRVASDKRFGTAGRERRVTELEDELLVPCSVHLLDNSQTEGVEDDYRRLVNEVMRLLLAKELFVFVTTEGVVGNNNGSERELRNDAQRRDTGHTNKKPTGAKRQSIIATRGVSGLSSTVMTRATTSAPTLHPAHTIDSYSTKWSLNKPSTSL